MQQAGWDPAYNARVRKCLRPAKSGKHRTWCIKQTGEDWDRVNLSVSTGTPNRNRSKPNLAPWFLHANHHGARRSGRNHGCSSEPTGSSPSRTTPRIGK